MAKIINSTCAYCGCGCTLGYEVEGDKIIKIYPVTDDPVSLGKPCVKGLTLDALDLSDRLLVPSVKVKGEEKEVSYEEALDFILEKTKNIKPEEVAFIGSGECTNEDNFVFAKFARLVFGSNNIDCCARLCHGSTTTAMRKVFGNPAMPNYMDDLTKSDLIIMTGTNPAGNYPVAFNRVIEAKKNGCKVVVIDIDSSESSRQADLFIPINFRSATALFGGMIKRVLGEKRYDSEAEKKDGFALLKESVAKFDADYVIRKCAISADTFSQLFNYLISAKRPTFMHGMGMTQHTNGVNNVVSILNLAILTKANTIPMRGKINVQGAGDMGSCPDWLPFGGSPSATQEFWHEKLNDIPGHHLTEFCYDPKVKVYFMLASNPAQSMPDLNRFYEQVKNTFVVYLHHHPSVTSEFADVSIPIPLLFENDGTISNGERRVVKVNSVNGKNQTIWPAWKFMAKLAHKLGKGEAFNYQNEADIFSEITKAVPAYAALDIKKITDDNNNFADKEKFFEKFAPFDDVQNENQADGEDYPLLLTTQRSPFHFNTGELTRRNTKLKQAVGEAICKINSKDALKYGINDKDMVVVESHLDHVTARGYVSDEFVEGVVTLPFHFEDCLVNKLFSLEYDPISRQPNLKSAWVKIYKK